MSEKKIKQEKNNKKKILLAVYVVDDEAVLESFLISLSRIDVSNFDVHYFFVNNNEKNDELLNEFKDVNENTTISVCPAIDKLKLDVNFDSDDVDEYFYMSEYYKFVTDYSLNNKFDYIFFTECVFTYHPLTLKNLVSLQKEIVSIVSWTLDEKGKESSNVKMFQNQDELNVSESDDNDKDNNNELSSKLKDRGLYKVGFFEGSFLLNCSIISGDLNFDPLYNICAQSVFDYFCIKCVVKQIDIFVDTNYPAVYMDIDYSLYQKNNSEVVEEVVEEKVKKSSKKKVKKPIKNKSNIVKENIVSSETVIESKPEINYQKEIVRPKFIDKHIDFESEEKIVEDKPKNNGAVHNKDVDDKNRDRIDLKEMALRQLYGNNK